jgi:hypothetical protein
MKANENHHDTQLMYVPLPTWSVEWADRVIAAIINLIDNQDDSARITLKALGVGMWNFPIPMLDELAWEIGQENCSGMNIPLDEGRADWNSWHVPTGMPKLEFETAVKVWEYDEYSDNIPF